MPPPHGKIMGVGPSVGNSQPAGFIHPIQGWRTSQNTTTVGGNFSCNLKPPAGAGSPPLKKSSPIPPNFITSPPTTHTGIPRTQYILRGIKYHPPPLVTYFWSRSWNSGHSIPRRPRYSGSDLGNNHSQGSSSWGSLGIFYVNHIFGITGLRNYWVRHLELPYKRGCFDYMQNHG